MTMAMAQSDAFDAEEPVIEAIRAGDRYAFSEFVRRQNGWVRGAIYGVLGERDQVDDVAQHAWTNVWKRIGELRDAKSWRPWLYRLVRNAAIDAGRDVTRRRRQAQGLAMDPPVRVLSNAPDGRAVAQEQHGAVLAAVQGLPALYREPFVLRHVAGWSYREIADVMGMPVDSVETRLVRARRFLRESLKDVVR
jgi:RNA polymerase sigma-70 factor (ECF subfamily)